MLVIIFDQCFEASLMMEGMERNYISLPLKCYLRSVISLILFFFFSKKEYFVTFNNFLYCENCSFYWCSFILFFLLLAVNKNVFVTWCTISVSVCITHRRLNVDFGIDKLYLPFSIQYIKEWGKHRHDSCEEDTTNKKYC